MVKDIKSKVDLDGIVVKPSVGQGNYADVPWICLLSTNPSISPSPQKGIYIVLLFNKQGNSFYLTLSQGITNFKKMELKTREMDKVILSTVEYFQEELKQEFVQRYKFSTDEMDLGENISNLAKGYIKTTIISKRYNVENFNEDDFYHSLSGLLFEYNEIIDHIAEKSYDDVISLISPSTNITTFDIALEKINESLKTDFVEFRDLTQVPVMVSRGALRPNKYEKLTRERIVKKIDYIQQAKEQQWTGLKGEELVLKLEEKRLEALGLDTNNLIKWSASESDSYGYDIESVDYRDGELVKIFIEVKSSKDYRDTSFFFSKKELEVSLQKKNNYRVYRIFDIKAIAPKYYIVDGQIEDNFYLDPVTFSARYKYEVK